MDNPKSSKGKGRDRDQKPSKEPSKRPKRGKEDNSSTEDDGSEENLKVIYVSLVGLFTGDIWHCALAQILMKYISEHAATKNPFRWSLSTCVLVFKHEGNTTCFDRGKRSWIYLKRIKMPCRLVRTQFPKNSKGRLGGSQIQYQSADRLSQDVVKICYDQQKDLEKKAKEAQQEAEEEEEEARKTKKAVLGPEYWELYAVELPDFRSPELEVEIKQWEDFIDLKMSTSIVMQLYQIFQDTDLENVREHFRNALSGFLLNQELKDTDNIRNDARARVNKLKKVIEESQTGEAKQKVLLFHYRIGDVNHQHDSNPYLLKQTKTLAEKHGLALVVVSILSEKDLDAELKKYKGQGSLKDYNVFYMYDADGSVQLDFRARVAFWTLIATELQHSSNIKNDSSGSSSSSSSSSSGSSGSSKRKGKEKERDPSEGSDDSPKSVHGLIGGRSGSMDLPAFVGVKCLSWDEPLFLANKLGSRRKKDSSGNIPTSLGTKGGWSGSWERMQAPQVLRLLNQRPLMSVCYLDGSKTSFEFQKPGKPKRFYKRLTEDDLLVDWLKDNRSNRLAIPTDADPRYMARILKDYEPKIEDPKLGIKAVYLQEYKAKIEELENGPATKGQGHISNVEADYDESEEETQDSQEDSDDQTEMSDTDDSAATEQAPPPTSWSSRRRKPPTSNQDAWKVPLTYRRKKNV